MVTKKSLDQKSLLLIVMKIILTYSGNKILVILSVSKRGRNIGPRPRRPLLPPRFDRAPGKSIIPSVLYRFNSWLYFSGGRRFAQSTTVAASPDGNAAQPDSLFGPGDSLSQFLVRKVISAVLFWMMEAVIDYVNRRLGISGSQ